MISRVLSMATSIFFFVSIVLQLSSLSMGLQARINFESIIATSQSSSLEHSVNPS